MAKKKQHKNNPFSLFFIMLLVVLIAVSAGFAFFYYSIFNRASRNEVITERAAELGASEQYFSNLFDAMVRQMNAIRYTKEIYTWGEGTDYTDYHAVMEILRENKAKHSAIHSIYAVFEQEDLVLTSNEGYFTIENFYDDTWKKYGTGEMDSLKDLKSVEISESHTLIPHSIGSANVVSLVCEMKTGSSWDNKNQEHAWLVFNISLNKIINVMNAETWADSNGQNEVAIVNGDGSIIYDGTRGALGYFLSNLDALLEGKEPWLEKTVGKKVWLCQKEELSEPGWYLLRVSDMNGVHGSVTLARNVMLVAVAICIMAVVFVLGLIWKQVYQPYNRLLEKARKGDMLTENGASMEYLERVIARTMDTKEILMESWFERTLLSGRAGGSGEQNMLELGQFCVLLISIHESEKEKLGYAMTGVQLTTLKTSIRQYFQEEQKKVPVKSCYCIAMTDQRLAVIVETPGQLEKENIETEMQLLVAWIEAQRNLNISIGVSMPHLGVGEMHKGYLEAKDSLGIYYFYPGRSVFYYKDTCGLKRDFYIENSVKVDIFTNNLYGMRIDEAKEALGLIVADLRKELESVIYYNLPNFFSRIFERVYRAVRNIGLEPEQFFGLTAQDDRQIFNTWEFDSMNEAVAALYQMLDKIQEYQNALGSQARKGNKQWAKIMLEYVDINYNRGISLASMAEELGLDETYLSKQFKEKIGVSFIQYVTKCRMDRAKELLADPSVKLAEIAELVGMGNVQSFIRAFKKYEGMTPGQYRDSCIEK